MKQENILPVWIGKPAIVGMLLLGGSVAAWTQAASPVSSPSQNDAMAAAIQQLQQQVQELRQAVSDVRAEAAQYRAETTELRRELQAMHTQSEPPSVAAAPAPNTAGPNEAVAETPPPTQRPTSTEQRLASLEESLGLLGSKVDDQYQTKVESASKYRVRLSGIVLMNLFSNRGQTDNVDIPDYVVAPGGTQSFGATLRQSEIGLEVFGPTFAGAKISGSLQADFAGGFANTWNGVNSGIFRLRTADMRMDWGHTALVVGQDDLFVSPLSPTSFASLAVPAFNYAGNLWAWTPQLRVEHRFDISENQSLSLQAGTLDNLTGEFPGISYFRSPSSGEVSGQPAYGLHLSWTNNFLGRPLTVGAAGYYGRQDWPFEHYVDAWAGMTDWQIPINSRLTLLGEFYRGRGVGGIGGGISRSVIYNGNPSLATTEVRGLDSIGGWSQLKLRATPKLEFNAGFGVDNPTASEIRFAGASQPYIGTLLTKNLSGLANFVYRPRSNLLFSAEFRQLQSFPVYGGSESAQQVNLVMGVLF